MNYLRRFVRNAEAIFNLSRKRARDSELPAAHVAIEASISVVSGGADGASQTVLEDDTGRSRERVASRPTSQNR
jgi:hypothetical protein